MRCTVNWAGESTPPLVRQADCLVLVLTQYRLIFTSTEDQVPRIIALSDHSEEETALHPALSDAMDAFMSYLLFWQDTIDHCKSAEVNDTLLDHFQVLFLEQLL